MTFYQENRIVKTHKTVVVYESFNESEPCEELNLERVTSISFESIETIADMSTEKSRIRNFVSALLRTVGSMVQTAIISNFTQVIPAVLDKLFTFYKLWVFNTIYIKKRKEGECRTNN